MKHERPVGRAASPFDDSAVERHFRMGLLDAVGKPNLNTITVLSQLYAGLFYDDLCDFYGSIEEVTSICSSLISLSDKSDFRQIFLVLCTDYDTMLCPLPEPIWWISGSAVLVPPFLAGFVRRLNQLVNKAGGETE